MPKGLFEKGISMGNCAVKHQAITWTNIYAAMLHHYAEMS